ncbi:response regulator [Candidatus Omnitrophota bacterium]
MHKILVIDDEPELVEILRKLLTKNNFEVLTALSSEQALEILESDIKIDLMVLDIRMPRITGIGILERMKKMNRNIPILILTGSLDGQIYNSDLVNLGYSLEDICYKPVDLFLVLGLIKKKLGIDSKGK